jgi:hypothetical protein
MNGIVTNVALKYDKEERVYALEYEPAEITEEERVSTKPADIRKCIHAGVLPACYEGTAIQVEMNGQSKISCFLLSDDGVPFAVQAARASRRTTASGARTTPGSR